MGTRITPATPSPSAKIPGHRSSRSTSRTYGEPRGRENRSGQHQADFDLTFVPPWHSSGIFHEGRSIYLGACCGLVIATREGKTVYHMGDTAIFSDMGLVNEIYRPQVGIVPIGDRFTMRARTAALACKRFFRSKR